MVQSGRVTGVFTSNVYHFFVLDIQRHLLAHFSLNSTSAEVLKEEGGEEGLRERSLTLSSGMAVINSDPISQLLHTPTTLSELSYPMVVL